MSLLSDKYEQKLIEDFCKKLGDLIENHPANREMKGFVIMKLGEENRFSLTNELGHEVVSEVDKSYDDYLAIESLKQQEN